MFTDLLKAAENAKTTAELQEVILQISTEAVQNGLSFGNKMGVHHLVLELSSKYSNARELTAYLMKVVLKCKTISGKQHPL